MAWIFFPNSSLYPFRSHTVGPCARSGAAAVAAAARGGTGVITRSAENGAGMHPHCLTWGTPFQSALCQSRRRPHCAHCPRWCMHRGKECLLWRRQANARSQKRRGLCYSHCQKWCQHCYPVSSKTSVDGILWISVFGVESEMVFHAMGVF